MKLDFEIAVDQQNKAHDQTFEVVPDSGCPPVPAGQPNPYLVILPNHLNMIKTERWGDLLVATNLPKTFKVLSKSVKKLAEL